MIAKTIKQLWKNTKFWWEEDGRDIAALSTVFAILFTIAYFVDDSASFFEIFLFSIPWLLALGVHAVRATVRAYMEVKDD